MLRTRWLATLAAAAAFAQTPPPAPTAQPASIAGTVTNSLTGEPLLRAHVALRGSSQIYGALTNGEGKFTIAPVPPGEYTLSADRVGFVAPLNGGGTGVAAYTLGPGDKREDVKVALIPTGAFTGRVLDSRGEPVQGATVAAEGSNGNGTNTTTDDQGQFRLGGLRPGKYRLRATPQSLPFPPEVRSDGTPDVHYSATYYPDSLTAKSAQRPEAKAGAELTGMDIRLVATQIVRVSGKVTGLPPDSKNVYIQIQPAASSEGSGQEQTSVKPDGSFEYWRLDPGKYTLVAGSMQGPLQSAPLEIEVTTAPLEHLELRLVPSFDVAGQVRFDDEQARQLPQPPQRPGQPPPPPVQRRMQLRGETNGQTVNADLGADDSFTAEKLQPARYHVEMLGTSGYVKSVRAGNTETEGDLLDLRNGPPGPVTVVVSSNFGEVSGTVNDSKGPAANVLVVLSGLSGMRSGWTDAGGAYKFTHVAPGKYKLVAPEDGAGIPQRSEDLEDYEDVAESVDLQAGDKISRDLKQRLAGK